MLVGLYQAFAPSDHRFRRFCQTNLEYSLFHIPEVLTDNDK